MSDKDCTEEKHKMKYNMKKRLCRDDWDDKEKI
jgi:hypothetical protein